MTITATLIRKVSYPLSLWKAGDAAQLRYLREFERTQWLSPDAIRDLQLERLRGLLAHAYDRCPFYRERFDRAGVAPADVRGLDDLRALPVLEKRDIQERRDDMVARDWPEADLIRNQTGGSTGTPISFFLSRARKQSRAAGTMRHNRWAGWDVGDKVACVWGAPRDVPVAGWRASVRNALVERQLFLDTAHLTAAKMADFHRALARFQPRTILAYAKAAVLFARFLKAEGLTPHRPHSIVTSAEVLEPEDRTLLEEVFDCPVFNRYGCREVSVVASECDEHAGLHTMAEGLYVEITDAAGKAHLPAGETGAILVTDLLNHAMPLIRYRIGDMAAWAAGACRCGRGLPRLAAVSGRVTDFIVGADGRLVSGVFLATYVIAQRPSLGQVQIVQDEAGKVRYRIKPAHNFHQADDLAYLERETRRYLGDGMAVDWEQVADLPPEPSGKVLFCRSTVAARLGR